MKYIIFWSLAVSPRVGRADIFWCLVVLVAAFGSQSATAQTSGFVYAANEGSNNVSAYTVDGATGALATVPGSPFPAGSAPMAITVDPTGQFVYVANCGTACSGSGPGDVYAYTIDGTTGALTAVPGSPFQAGMNPESVTVDPTGQFVYVGNFNSANVSAYTIDGTTGALTEVPDSPFLAGLSPFSVTVDPTGQFAYAANWNSNNVSAYTIDGTTGALTEVPGSPFPAGALPASVAVDPTGQFVYVGNFNSANVSAYSIDGTTGALTAVPSSPFQAGPFPNSVTVDATGQFVYVADCGSCGISWGVSAYTIDGASGALTPVLGSPFARGNGVGSVTVDATGQFVYAANAAGGSNVSAYTIDGTTGALVSNVPGSPFPAGFSPRGIAATTGPAPPPLPGRAAKKVGGRVALQRVFTSSLAIWPILRAE